MPETPKLLEQTFSGERQQAVSGNILDHLAIRVDHQWWETMRNDVVIRTQQPRFSDDLHLAKSAKRKADRLWRRTRLTVHRE